MDLDHIYLENISRILYFMVFYMYDDVQHEKITYDSSSYNTCIINTLTKHILMVTEHSRKERMTSVSHSTESGLSQYAQCPH